MFEAHSCHLRILSLIFSIVSQAHDSRSIFLSLTRYHLLLILLTRIIILLLGGLGLLSPDTTWASSSKWRSEGKVDMLLGVETDNERWDVNDLLSNTVVI
jgi:hypothetical protein